MVRCITAPLMVCIQGAFYAPGRPVPFLTFHVYQGGCAVTFLICVCASLHKFQGTARQRVSEGAHRGVMGERETGRNTPGGKFSIFD